MPLARGPAIPGQPASPQLAVQVVSSLASLDHELSKIKLWLILVAIGGTGLAAGAGFLVARSHLRPVRRLRDTAEHVRNTPDLTQRIEVTGNDELSQLRDDLQRDARVPRRRCAAPAPARPGRIAELRTPLTSLRTNIEVLASNDTIPSDDGRSCSPTSSPSFRR